MLTHRSIALIVARVRHVGAAAAALPAFLLNVNVTATVFEVLFGDFARHRA
jgi:hypothetical protein